jgi:hypothetical protein
VSGSYDLSKLGPDAFEHMVNAIALKVLGAGVTGFCPGPDAGRDRWFVGEAPYPSAAKHWNGTWIIQSKRPAQLRRDATCEVCRSTARQNRPPSHRLQRRRQRSHRHRPSASGRSALAPWASRVARRRQGIRRDIQKWARGVILCIANHWSRRTCSMKSAAAQHSGCCRWHRPRTLPFA